MEKRTISTELIEEDYKIENSLRPKFLTDYIGQRKVKENLEIYIEAAKARKRSTGSCFIVWSSGTWKNHAGRDHCQ